MYIYIFFLHEAHVDAAAAALFLHSVSLFYAPQVRFVFLFFIFFGMLLLLSYAILFSSSWHVFTQLWVLWWILASHIMKKRRNIFNLISGAAT